MNAALTGRRIVVPETRELDVLARMLERHGATTLRCPLVLIKDHPDAAPIVEWLRRFTSNPPDDLILLTGEGLRRLQGFAARADLEGAFLSALREVRKITRGPKPARRLHELGLKPDIAADPPTSAGVLASLMNFDLRGRRIGIQLYPDNPNHELIDPLRQAGAHPDPVLCYIYASKIEDEAVIQVINEMASGRVDLITFTSSPQVRRLSQVAEANHLEAALQEGLRRTKIAAVGPLVAQAIEQAGGTVSITPPDNFHMKPMVNAIVAAIASDHAASS
jgi:uroporphyrinogen-III synthase